MTTLISKTTLPFCHEWQRVRVLSRHLIGRASISIIIIIVITIIIILSLRIRSHWGGGGEASGAKPPMITYCRAIRLTRTFTWYSFVESVSRRSSMCWSCAMMSPSDTSLVEEKGEDVDGADRDGAEWEGEAADPNCLDLNCASLHLTVAASMANIKEKWSNAGKGTENWRMILVIAEGKMSLSRDAESLWTSMIERIKWEVKFIVRCLRRDSKNRARGSVIEL